MKDKEKQIINELNKVKKLSTTKIASIIKSNYERALELLTNLKKKKIVKQNKELMGVSWSLNE
jgi:heme oxygenase